MQFGRLYTFMLAQDTASGDDHNAVAVCGNSGIRCRIRVLQECAQWAERIMVSKGRFRLASSLSDNTHALKAYVECKNDVTTWIVDERVM